VGVEESVAKAPLQSKNTNNAKSEVRFKQLILDLIVGNHFSSRYASKFKTLKLLKNTIVQFLPFCDDVINHYLVTSRMFELGLETNLN
jgi:hypothetical protein